MSPRKNSCEPDLAAFGDFEVLRPLKGSPRGCVFLVTDGKRQMVAKSTRQSEDSLEWVQRAKRYAEEAGFITPRSYRTRDGALASNGWALESFEHGTPYPERSLPDLAGAMRTFRSLSKSMPQRPGFLASCDLLYKDKGAIVDLTLLPANVVTAARAAWAVFCDEPLETVHGDLGQGNILMTNGGRAVLLDWDDARKDAALFDEFPLIPRNRATPEEHRAYLAWEAASGWSTEPEYARRIADRLLSLGEKA